MDNKTITVLILSATILTASCTKTNEAETTSDTVANTIAATTITETDPPSDTSALETSETLQETEMPQVYENLINDYCTAISNGIYRDEYYLSGTDYYSFSTTGDVEIIINNGSPEHNCLEDFGYALNDVDNNGTPELLISDTNTNNSEDHPIYTMFSINENGEAVRLFVSWSRSRKYLCEDGRIINPGSSGAAYQSVFLYSINGTEVVGNGRLDIIGIDSGTVYVLNENDISDNQIYDENYDMVIDEQYIVSEDEANNWINEHIIDTTIEFTPFSEFASN